MISIDREAASDPDCWETEVADSSDSRESLQAGRWPGIPNDGKQKRRTPATFQSHCRLSEVSVDRQCSLGSATTVG